MKRKLLLALVLTVILTCVCTKVVARADDAPWSGSGTESDPWLITTAADLVALRDYVAATENATTGKYFKQTVDISLSEYCGENIGDWTPIGNHDDGKCLNGTYDGNGHKVTGLYISNGGKYFGLFAGNNQEGTIENLTVEGSVSGERVGGIAGYNKNLIQNCHFKGTVTGTETQIGGIVGSSCGLVQSCTVEGDIHGKDITGGISGNVQKTGVVKDCSFTGTVSGRQKVGGIAGYTRGTVSNCHFNGTVNASFQDMGGIAGFNGPGGLIKDCGTEGSVVGGAGAGGISGESNGSFTNCINRCSVTGSISIGGITGTAARGMIYGCKNYGEVKASGTAGGIVGNTFNCHGIPGTVENCENYGNVSYGYNLGGIVGHADVGYVRDSTNYGAISGSDKVGGIAGYSAVKISGSTNEGSVTGTTNVGDIVGYSLLSVTVTLDPNGAPGEQQEYTVSSPAAVPACPYTHPDYSFFAWNTDPEGMGTWYMDGESISEEGLTLYAFWMNRKSVSYVSADGASVTSDAFILRSGYLFDLPEEKYVVSGDVSIGYQLTIHGYVDLILEDGSKLDVWGGIAVAEEDSLTVWGQSAGSGSLYTQADPRDAGIGGGVGMASSVYGCGEVIINGGTVTAIGGEEAAGIGIGYDGYGGTVTINGGTVTAIGGIGAQAIDADLELGGVCIVPQGASEPMAASARFAACRGSEVTLQPCHHSPVGTACRYCDKHAPIEQYISGRGTADDPYQLGDYTQWRRLASWVNEGLIDTEGMYFRMTNDFATVGMLGTKEHPFKGHFDGTGYSISVTLSDTSGANCALFRYASNATFSNLCLYGKITSGNGSNAGLVGSVSGSCEIVNCRSSVKIDTSACETGTHGGFVGSAENGAVLTIRGCLFDGQFTGANASAVCSGFVGMARRSGTVIILDSVFDPSRFDAVNFYSFVRGVTGAELSVENSYMPGIAGNGLGKQSHTVTADEGVTIDFGEGTAYDVCGITAYPIGVMYRDAFCAGLNDVVTLALSYDPPEGSIMAGFAANVTLYQGLGDQWMLTVPDEDVIIYPVIADPHAAPDFSLPAAISAIEEEAFEGAAMTIVWVPDTCLSIGDHAFRSCMNLTQIRIPAGCEIGTDIFDGCSMVVVFGTAGSAAEAYCSSHDNCVFVEDVQN